MAAASTIPATSAPRFRRSDIRTTTPATRVGVLPLRHGIRHFHHSYTLSELRNDGMGLHVNHRVQIAFASSSNPPPPNPDAGKRKLGSSSSGVADGPPLATILAGIVVFLLVCWVLGSIIMWLIGLIVNVPPS